MSAGNAAPVPVDDDDEQWLLKHRDKIEPLMIAVNRELGDRLGVSPEQVGALGEPSGRGLVAEG